MNILVTGANGQLGNEMRIVSKSTNDNYIFTDVNQVEGLETTYLDITDLEAIRKIVKDNDVNAIVNCAAWTNVDGAEAPEKYDLVEKLNATAPENLAKAIKEVGGWLIQISTDYVFGKEPYNTPCNPDQKGTPTGVYGLTKLHGEQRIKSVFENLSKGGSFPMRESGDRGRGSGYVIIRTAWLYSEFGKNFCKTMLNLTATKPALKVVFDQCGTPTYALDLANAIKKILETVETSETPKAYSGVYHFSNEGVTSWYDFTQMIQRIAIKLGYYKSLPNSEGGSLPLRGSEERACSIQPCYSSEFPSPVTRPAYSVLDKRSIKETFDVEVPYWVDSLEKCIANLMK